MTLPPTLTGLGGILAFIVLLLAIIFTVIGQLALIPGCLIAALALARLIP